MTERPIRVMIVHNKYRLPGGEDVVVRAETEMLRARGHEVSEFVCKNPPALNNPINLSEGVLWQIRQQASDFGPDIIHVHNTFFMISSAIYDLCESMSIPSVQTVHNYRFACPSANLFRSGAVCRDCVGRSFPWPGVFRRCAQGSALKTAYIGWNYGSRAGRARWIRAVKAFIVLSGQMRVHLIDSGIPESKIHVKPNFIGRDPGESLALGAYALYVGRLTREKGIHDLIEKWKPFDRYPLKIVGTGTDAAVIRKAVHDSGLKNVELIGYKDSNDVYGLMRAARAVIVPSIWEEPFGLAAIEAMACGRPVLAQRSGALNDIIQDGQNGYLYTASLREEFEYKLTRLFEDDTVAYSFGASARKSYLDRFTPQANYPILMNIYEQALRGV